MKPKLGYKNNLKSINALAKIDKQEEEESQLVNFFIRDKRLPHTIWFIFHFHSWCIHDITLLILMIFRGKKTK
jgi:hypothetical protein